MPDYTTDERWRRGPRKHTARRWYNTAKGGLVLRCDGCDYEPVEGTAREQEDAHRAHRVAMGENVKAERTPPVRERLKQAEGAIARVRAHCELLADASCRVAARETAQDVIRLLDGDTPAELFGPPPGAGVCDRCKRWGTAVALYRHCPSCGRRWDRVTAPQEPPNPPRDLPDGFRAAAVGEQ